MFFVSNSKPKPNFWKKRAPARKVANFLGWGPKKFLTSEWRDLCIPATGWQNERGKIAFGTNKNTFIEERCGRRLLFGTNIACWFWELSCEIFVKKFEKKVVFKMKESTCSLLLCWKSVLEMWHSEKQQGLASRKVKDGAFCLRQSSRVWSVRCVKWNFCQKVRKKSCL